MKYCRKKEKMKLSALAEKINVPIFVLKSYETDRKELPYELARKIATVLHTTAGHLLGWEADPFLADIYNQKTNEDALFDDDDDDEPFSDNEDDWNEENESISLFYEMMYKSEEEKDDIIDTGVFNTYIEGYMLYTLQALGCSDELIKNARNTLYDAVLTDYDAKDARMLSDSKKPTIITDDTCTNILEFPTDTKK